tara:strand:+ start:566 stop:823 length:258 start_codon:yes stop_codon:yes gene_type:complete
MKKLTKKQIEAIATKWADINYLNGAVAKVMGDLDIETGDAAGVFFDGDCTADHDIDWPTYSIEKRQNLLTNYINFEIRHEGTILI